MAGHISPFVRPCIDYARRGVRTLNDFILIIAQGNFLSAVSSWRYMACTRHSFGGNGIDMWSECGEGAKGAQCPLCNCAVRTGGVCCVCASILFILDRSPCRWSRCVGDNIQVWTHFDRKHVRSFLLLYVDIVSLFIFMEHVNGRIKVLRIF